MIDVSRRRVLALILALPAVPYLWLPQKPGEDSDDPLVFVDGWILKASDLLEG